MPVVIVEREDNIKNMEERLSSLLLFGNKHLAKLYYTADLKWLLQLYGWMNINTAIEL